MSTASQMISLLTSILINKDFMDANMAAESGKRSKAILTISLPAEAAAKMQEPGFLKKLNELLADADLPRVESIEPVSSIQSTGSAS